MARKAKDTSAAMFRTSITLEQNHRFALDLVAPGNTSEAVRYLIRYAIQHGALEPFRPKPMNMGAPVVTQQTVDPFAGWDDDD